MSNAVFKWQPGADLFQKWLFAVAEAIEDRPGARGAYRPGSRPAQYTGRDPYAGDPLVFGGGGGRGGQERKYLWHGGPFLIESIAQAPKRVATRRYARSSD